MRDIKFRAWRKPEKKMYPEITAISFEWQWWSYYWYDFEWLDNIIIMQYTWLKDKNWKEIYEWDIFELTYKETQMDNVELIKWEITFLNWCYYIKFKHPLYWKVLYDEM